MDAPNYMNVIHDYHCNSIFWVIGFMVIGFPQFAISIEWPGYNYINSLAFK